MNHSDDSSSSVLTLKGKTALVTGASSGLGEHFVHVLARAGARVALAARRSERLARVKEAFAASATEVFTVAMDVNDRPSVDAAIDKITGDFAPIDILVNNAGIADTQPFLEMSEQAWQRVIDTNLSGVWRVSQAVARTLVARHAGGAIVNIASILGLGVQPTQTNYASAKAGVIQLTRAMARELWRENIRVNAIAPGYFVTEMNRDFFASDKGQAYVRRLLPGRTGELEELDGPLLLLASDAGSYITGVTLPVDGGTLLAGV